MKQMQMTIWQGVNEQQEYIYWLDTDEVQLRVQVITDGLQLSAQVNRVN